MRELDECKAEIFRRMKKGIRQRRRRRNGILLCCVPLFLCFVIWSGNFLSQNIVNNYVPEKTVEYTEAEIVHKNNSSDGHYKTTDKETVNRLYSIVDTAFAEGQEASVYSEGVQSNDNDTCITNEAISPLITKYKIVFCLPNGETAVYLVTDNMIINQTTNQRKLLTEESVNTLLENLDTLIKRG